jgi:hypothetical protein
VQAPRVDDIEPFPRLNHTDPNDRIDDAASPDDAARSTASTTRSRWSNGTTPGSTTTSARSRTGAPITWSGPLAS